MVNIEIDNLFRKKEDNNCRKCGVSLTNPHLPHNEKECDYVQILPEHIVEATKVDDITEGRFEVMIKSGYGVMELSKIHKIMKELVDNSKNIRNTLVSGNTNLFNEAKKIYYEGENN